MTRGREHNHAYVIVDTADDNHGAPDGEHATATSVLLGVLANSGAELSAHQMIKTEQDACTSIAQLAAEYETLAAAAQRDRWASLIRSCSLTREEADSAIESEAFGPLAAELRRAEANGHDIERLLPAAVARYGLGDATDVAAVLRHRLALATKTALTGRGRRPAKFIAGLIPEALGPMARPTCALPSMNVATSSSNAPAASPRKRRRTARAGCGTWGRRRSIDENVKGGCSRSRPWLPIVTATGSPRRQHSARDQSPTPRNRIAPERYQPSADLTLETIQHLDRIRA